MIELGTKVEIWFPEFGSKWHTGIVVSIDESYLHTDLQVQTEFGCFRVPLRTEEVHWRFPREKVVFG